MNSSIIPHSGNNSQLPLPLDVNPINTPAPYEFKDHEFSTVLGWNGERLIPYWEAARYFDPCEFPYEGQYIPSDDETFMGEFLPNEYQELKNGIYLTLNGFYRLAVCHMIDRRKSHESGIALGALADSLFPSNTSLAEAMRNSPLNRHEGWIYVARCGKEFKIGRSVKGPDDRLISIQTGNPRKVYLELAIYVREFEWVESVLHCRFSEKRQRGEWFLLDRADLRYIESLAKQFIRL